MSDDTRPRTGEGAARTTAGSLAPRVPFLTPVDGVDLGPAGSLIQARALQRALRAGERAAHPLTRRCCRSAPAPPS